MAAQTNQTPLRLTRCPQQIEVDGGAWVVPAEWNVRPVSPSPPVSPDPLDPNGFFAYSYVPARTASLDSARA